MMQILNIEDSTSLLEMKTSICVRHVRKRLKTLSCKLQLSFSLSNSKEIETMSKVYTITVTDSDSIKLIDKAIASAEGKAEKVLHRGAYDFLFRKAYQEKRNSAIKEALAFMAKQKK